MSEDLLAKLKIPKAAAGPSSNRKRPAGALIAIVVLAPLLIVAFWAYRGRGIEIESVTVSRVYPTHSFTLLNASGYVVAQRKAAVASKITGRLEWIGVEEGSRVSAGQVIARLENLDLEAAVRQGEAAVDNAKAALEQLRAELNDAERLFGRQKELLKEGIIAQADFDAADARHKRAIAGVAGGEAGVRNSVAALRGARVTYDFSLIRAPFGAVVLTKNADVGDIITPLGAAANAKAAVVTIADLGSLQVEADVSESNLGQVKMGQPCEITLDALPEARFRGVLHTIVPTADRSKASVLVKVRFIDKDARLLPEMSARVAFLEREATRDDQRPRTAVNPAVIVSSGEREGVWLVRDGRVLFTPVRRGAKLGELVEVTGVKSGDRVALKPLERLKEGARVRTAEK
ncbi:MAG: efflux RND transporter periplasmic adaptor subunit [Deltaproteobacteria bacterium]|nr:efflux RND transporter periplasmic adaptor subunit [Deltaproteobacteria bacterium]